MRSLDEREPIPWQRKRLQIAPSTAARLDRRGIPSADTLFPRHCVVQLPPIEPVTSVVGVWPAAREPVESARAPAGSPLTEEEAAAAEPLPCGHLTFWRPTPAVLLARFWSWLRFWNVSAEPGAVVPRPVPFALGLTTPAGEGAPICERLVAAPPAVPGPPAGLDPVPEVDP
jgi:hypothetical protein